jgi:hypothetical protein
MFERITTKIAAITFIGSLLFGGLISIIDLLWTVCIGYSLIDINLDVVLVIVIFAAPVSLILIYLGQGLDYIFKTKRD